MVSSSWFLSKCRGMSLSGNRQDWIFVLQGLILSRHTYSIQRWCTTQILNWPPSYLGNFLKIFFLIIKIKFTQHTINRESININQWHSQWYANHQLSPLQNISITPKRQLVFRDTILEVFSREWVKKRSGGLGHGEVYSRSSGKTQSGQQRCRWSSQTYDVWPGRTAWRHWGTRAILALYNRGEKGWRRKKSGGKAWL